MKIRKINMHKPKIAVLGEHPASKRLAKAVSSQGYTVDQLTGWKMPFQLLFKGRNYSVIHANTPLSSFAMWCASWINHVPTVCHVHETSLFNSRWTPMQSVEAQIYLRLKFSQQLSRSQAFLKLKNVNQAMHVNPEINVEAYQEVEPKKNSAGFHALYSGPIEKHKGLFLLLEAVHRLVHSSEFINSHKDFVLHIMGTGSQRPQLEAQIEKLELKKHVRFHGKKSGERRIQAYKNADLFVLPSHHDALPYELLEAAAAGLPILASDTGDHRSLVNENQNGHLFPVGDLDELSYYLHYYALNPHLENMGAASLNLVENEFEDGHNTEKMLKVYDELIHGTHKETPAAKPEIMPWELPQLFIQSRRFNAVKKTRKPLNFCFTVNVEEDEHLDGFFKRFLEFADQQEIKSTLFVQRDLMNDLLPQLQEAKSAGHEIGVHALQKDWQDRPTRRKMLRQMREEQAELGLSPRMFRAPGKVDQSDLGILHEQDYEFLPTSRDPRPQLQWRNGLPFGTQLKFSLHNLLTMSDDALLKSINRLSNLQRENGIAPFVIFECQSWEFNSCEKADYASGENFTKLAKKIAFLRQHMGLNFISLSSFCAQLDKQHS